MSNTSSRPGVFTGYTISPLAVMQSGFMSVAFISSIPSGDKNTISTLISIDDLLPFATHSSSIFYKTAKLILQNGVKRLIVVNVGQSPSTQDYSDALDLLLPLDIQIVITDTSSADVITPLKNHVLSASANLHERIAFASSDSVDSTLTLATSLDCERLVLVAPSASTPSDTSPHHLYSTASIASLIATLPDNTSNTNSATLLGLSSLPSPLTSSQIELCLSKGVTPLEQVGDHVEVIKVVTTKQNNPLSNLSSVLTIDSLHHDMRALLKNYIKIAKNTSVTRQSIASQLVILLSGYQQLGKLDTFDYPVISVSPSDPSVCNISLAVTVASNLDQIIITAHIRL